jgi:fucose 4-O-acetylase-like acetyltransferase
MAAVTPAASPRSAGRNDLIDALKLFAMGLVVLTHVLGLRHEFKALSPQTVDIMVTFNMPLFTFLSGYVLFGREGKSPLRFIRGKTLALLVPYLAWILVELPLRHYPPSAWLPRLGRALVDPHAGLQMWFLWLLFWLFVIFTLARLVSKDDRWMAAGAVAMGATLFLGTYTGYGLDKITWLYPFFILGYLFAKHRERLVRFDAIAAVLSVVAFPALIVWAPAGVVVRFATALAGAGASWAIFRLLPGRVLAPLGFVGQKTLGLYGWQMVVLPYLIVGAGWLGAATSWTLVMVVATLLTLVLERTAFTRAAFL